KVTASEDAIGWLNKRLEHLKDKLRESEIALQKFQEKEDIITLESVLSDQGSKENLVVQKMAELNNKLTAARTERIGLETLFRQLQELEKRPGMVESIPYVIQNDLIQTLKTNLIELGRRYSELREKYGNKHPLMIGLKKEIAGLNERLANEVKKIAKSVEIQYRMALAKENSLQGALDQTKSEVMDLNKKAIQYGVLKREVDTNRQLYDMILKRAKETSLTSGLKSTNIFVIDDAETPRAPIGPQTEKKVTMAAILGLLLALGLAFLLEHLDNTIHGPEEIGRYLDVPFLGPAGLASWDGDGRASELVVIKEPRSHFAESLRNIRTNILFSFTEPEQKTVVITSPGPMEGKTFISCNLAVAMAKMGRRVLLIDADMRKPRVHKVFNLEAKPGLSHLIVGRCELQEALRNTWLKHLQVIPAGKIPPNPSELLGSRRMQRLLAQLKEYYEFIVFDTPPVLSVTDGAVLSGVMDGAVLTVKASETTKECAQLALKNLADVRARVLGVIVNQVDFRKNRYYYNYYYKYYDYYAKDGEKRERKSRRSDTVSPGAAAMIS
ncbi:MAG: polysaccharide biosynthesis tyrosine autokinase, partial [Anaerolineales bacterium]